VHVAVAARDDGAAQPVRLHGEGVGGEAAGQLELDGTERIAVERRTPLAQLALVACVLARSSVSPLPKPRMVPANARGSLSTARALAAKASVWSLPTPACKVIVSPAATESTPLPATRP
jgi:hypothetical protein